jgi:hypothetical protein
MEAALRMVPAHQHLAAGHEAAADVQLRLVVELQLLPLHRPAQLDHQRHLVGGADVHVLAMEAVAALLLLRVVHRHVGAAEQGAGVGAVLGEEGDADAGADFQHLPVHHERLFERVQDAAGGDGGGVRVGGGRQHDRELVTAEARHHVAGAHLVLQAEGDLLQQRVAELVAERVVHFLEAVEVHQHQRGHGRLAPRRLDGRFQRLEEERAVRQAGQGVVHGLVPQRRDLVLRDRDVAQEGDPVRELPRVLDRDELQVELELRAVRTPRRDLRFERAMLEDVLQQRLDHRLLPLDDPEDLRRLPDDVFRPPPVDRAEAVVHESDARSDRLHRRRQDRDPVGRDANCGAEQAQLLPLDPLLGQLPLVIHLGHAARMIAWRRSSLPDLPLSIKVTPPRAVPSGGTREGLSPGSWPRPRSR